MVKTINKLYFYKYNTETIRYGAFFSYNIKIGADSSILHPEEMINSFSFNQLIMSLTSFL